MEAVQARRRDDLRQLSGPEDVQVHPRLGQPVDQAQRLESRDVRRLADGVGHGQIDVDDRLGGQPGHRGGADVLDGEQTARRGPQRFLGVPVAPPSVEGGVWGGVNVGRVVRVRRSGWCRCGRVGSGARGGVVHSKTPGRDHAVVPGGEGLESVVVATQRGRGSSVVVGPGWGLPSASASWSYSVDVVDVAAPGGSGAPREHAGAVAENDLFADPVGDLVRRGGELGGEVDDGLDGDQRAGVAAPAPDLVEQDQSLALLHAAGGTEDRLLAHDRGVEVGVDDDLARDRQTVLSMAGAVTLAEQVERGLGAGEVPEGLGAAYVERLGRPERLLQSRRHERGRGRGRGRRRGRGRPRGAGSRRSGRRPCRR